MRLRARHSCSGVRFRDMDDETLRLVLKRLYRHAADSLDDRHSAQTELRRRKQNPPDGGREPGVPRGE